MSGHPKFEGHCCSKCLDHFKQVYSVESDKHWRDWTEEELRVPHGAKCGTPYVEDLPNIKERKRQGYYNIDDQEEEDWEEG